MRKHTYTLLAEFAGQVEAEVIPPASAVAALVAVLTEAGEAGETGLRPDLFTRHAAIEAASIRAHPEYIPGRPDPRPPLGPE